MPHHLSQPKPGKRLLDLIKIEQLFVQNELNDDLHWLQRSQLTVTASSTSGQLDQPPEVACHA